MHAYMQMGVYACNPLDNGVPASCCLIGCCKSGEREAWEFWQVVVPIQYTQEGDVVSSEVGLS